MKKSFAAICGFLLMIFPAFSQNPGKAVTISFGPSFPVGDFTSTSEWNHRATFATTGISANIGYSHILPWGFSLEAIVLGQQNALDVTALKNELSGMQFFDDPAVSVPTFYDVWTLPVKKWRFAALMAGLSKAFKINDASPLSFSPKVLGGVMYAHLPKVFAESKMQNSYAIYSVGPFDGFGFSAVGALDVSYSVNKRVNAIIIGEYLHTGSIQFKNSDVYIAATHSGLIIPGLFILSNSRNMPNAQRFRSDEEAGVRSINVRLGIQLLF